MFSVAHTRNHELIGGASGIHSTMWSYRCQDLKSTGWHTVVDGTQLQNISRELCWSGRQLCCSGRQLPCSSRKLPCVAEGNFDATT
jgi:hypothetical protein